MSNYSTAISTTAPITSPLAGCCVLVVEDEPMVAMLIEDLLGELGCEVVATAAHYDEALKKAGSLSFDVAVLDVNLHGKPSFPIAAVLAERRLPFVFATGYGAGGMRNSAPDVPVLQKPFHLRDLETALRAALAKPPAH